MKVAWYILILYQNMCEQIDIDWIGYDIELMTFREKMCVRVLLKMWRITAGSGVITKTLP